MLFFKKRPKKEPEKLKVVKKAKEIKKAEKAEKPKKKPRPIEEKKIPEAIPPSSAEALEGKKTPETVPLPQKKYKTAYQVLVRPIVTEKATETQAQGAYTFEVAPVANKILVARAVEELYNVRPIRVNIIRVQGKVTRYGRSVGRTKNWKKALVFLKKGQKIEFVKK